MALPYPADAYELLWRLSIGGVLNLNLDRLAARAFQLVHAGRVLHEFSGHEAGHYIHVLKSPHPFIVNLHGVAEDSSNWVWTSRQLTALFASPGYGHQLPNEVVLA